MTPFANLPESAFWKTGVAQADPLSVKGLYQRKFKIGAEDRIATAGSCFAQHINGALRMRGYRVMDVEPGPPWLDKPSAGAHGYGLFSARYGNIYTARQLLQLAREAFGEARPSELAWERNGRYFDAQRPGVDPEGLDSIAEVRALRDAHLEKVHELFSTMDVFIFTLGLTEAWTDADGKTVFPTAPGTIAGVWDPNRYRFRSFTQAEVMAHVRGFQALIAKHNPGLRMILTVSPVPLTATASGQHVLAATTYSKSVLRAAAGELAAGDEAIDYFPSYEMIASPFSRAAFYEANLRSVRGTGIQAVMRVFFSAHPPLHAGRAKEDEPMGADELHCEEQLQEAFAP